MKLKSIRTDPTFILTTLMLMVAAATASAQTYTDLYNMNNNHGYCWGSCSGPSFPQGRNGKLYGTTPRGGADDAGVVFRITPSGKEKVRYDFDDVWPGGGLTLGTDGNFYGTSDGGANNLGAIFKISESGNLTILYSFTEADGGPPEAPPVEGTDGNFYGTAAGNAYKVTPSGAFTAFALPGRSEAPLLQATDGSFYGTTYSGGNVQVCYWGGCGTVFKMTPKGIVTIVYSFDLTHGLYPYAPVIQGSDGNFYGTTAQGGTNSCTNQSVDGCGTAFKLTPQGAITVLHNFGDPNYPNDGTQPNSLMQATDGNLYGTTDFGGTGWNCGWETTCGVIFQITPAGAYSILYNFDPAHGGLPYSAPMQHTNGTLYGMANYGGTHLLGVVYSFDTGLGPFVILVRTLGKVGKTVGVLGQGFTGTTAVSFNGTAATYAVVTDTYLKATVPSGATTGFVTVTTPSGTLTSNKQFTVKP